MREQGETGGGDAGVPRNAETWNTVSGGTVAGPVVQAQHIGQLSIHQAAPPPPPSPAEDPWARLAADSPVWDHVPQGRDAAPFRECVAAAAARLAEQRDLAERLLAADPWQDPGLPARFLDRIEWLLGEPGRGPALDLYPAEAALLVLTPFLYRLHTLRRAVRAAVDPSPPEADEARASFETYAEEHALLRKRALLHPEAAAPIHWWLRHRWLAQRTDFGDPEAVRELLALVPDAARALGDALDPLRVSRLLHGLRRGPGVCNPEYLDLLPADDRVVGGPRHQRIRDRRLCLLLALAYGTSVEMTALPDIVAEHLGVPHPVDPAQLRRTLDASGWGGSPDLPVLRAQCHHEAVIEALRAYTVRADDLLHAVHRTVHDRVTEPLPPLPTRLSADGVVPAAGVLKGWAGFRLDEHRVRDLLMGVQLYKDPELALRELYQNALDACRYRRARTAYLDRTEPAAYAYEGRIAFAQGVDEDGREYVECRDNGIGMGDAELRGVFSHAGARFAEQPDFKLEQADWRRLDPPVPFFPNSRFGIGVLSYFMLADEIRVRTCRMGRDGTPGPQLEVSVFGPGHLFRIVERAPRGEEPGTRVRLYLRDTEERAPGWSCVDGLERVLGIAEFPTVARHGRRMSVWPAGELKPREGAAGERFGLNAHHRTVRWREAPDGVQVVWCERGGGVLVDGLVVHPAVRRGVLSQTGPGLTGAVVNLSGAFAPERLSADRTEILDEVSDTVREVLAEAARDLVATEQQLPTFDWISSVAEHSVQLADVVAAATAAAGRRLTADRWNFDTARTGCLPGDPFFLEAGPLRVERYPMWTKVDGAPYDHVLLWRILAHRPNPVFDTLAAFHPDLRTVDAVLPALPSDQLLLAHRRPGQRHWTWIQHAGAMQQAALERAAARLGPEAVRRRAAALGLPLTPSPAAAPAHARNDRPDVLLLRDLRDPGPDLRQWLDPEEPVPPGHLAQAACALGIPLPEIAAVLRRYGFEARPGPLPDVPDEAALTLLSADANGCWPWLSPAEPVPAGHVLSAARKLHLAPGDVLERLIRYGFRPPDPFPADACDADRPLLPWRAQPVTYERLFHGARTTGRSLEEVLTRLRAYGIEVPLRLPHPRTALDDELLSPDGPCAGWRVDPAEVLPFARAVVASQDVRAAPEDIAARLASYGIRISGEGLPDGLSYGRALTLLSFYGSWHSGTPVTLQALLPLTAAMDASLAQVIAWLTALGIPVADIGETLRGALARVPLLDAAGATLE
ncbi:hypothetical protein [Streptomyces natalensis]|uniref:wHTH domain-containing protein n=1 Tax=Streptomyces natalensis TaxID=68242 RepID=UPI00069CBE34|nr:hypothetical protein [Streptomyces natalensis]